jgi:hypothetical protein
MRRWWARRGRTDRAAGIESATEGDRAVVEAPVPDGGDDGSPEDDRAPRRRPLPEMRLLREQRPRRASDAAERRRRPDA